MLISADTLTQAREALVQTAQERISLIAQVKDQGRKISDLEREVQKQANARSAAEQMLAESHREIEALRAQLPTDAAIRAHEALANYLSAPSEIHPSLRSAA